MSALVDQALHVASAGWFQDPGDRLRGALVALLDAGMLTAPPAVVPPVAVVREFPPAAVEGCAPAAGGGG